MTDSDSDSDIEIDEEPKAKPPKVKSATPVWMVIMVILAFGCFAATIAMQFMEYQYLRGKPLIEKDSYATQVLIPQG